MHVLDRVAHVLRPAPLPGMDCDPQPFLPGFQEQGAERPRREARHLMPRQIQPDHAPLPAIQRRPDGLQPQFNRLVTVDRYHQPDADPPLLGRIRRRVTDPCNHIPKAEVHPAGQRPGCKAQLQVADAIRRRVGDGLGGDAPDDLRRAVELAQHIELAQEARHRAGVVAHHLHMRAQTIRIGRREIDPVGAGDLRQRLQPD